jgi:hypothetical protein
MSAWHNRQRGAWPILVVFKCTQAGQFGYGFGIGAGYGGGQAGIPELRAFWQDQLREIEQVPSDPAEFKNHQLPLARIKKVGG